MCALEGEELLLQLVLEREHLDEHLLRGEGERLLHQRDALVVELVCCSGDVVEQPEHVGLPVDLAGDRHGVSEVRTRVKYLHDVGLPQLPEVARALVDVPPVLLQPHVGVAEELDDVDERAVRADVREDALVLGGQLLPLAVEQKPVGKKQPEMKRLIEVTRTKMTINWGDQKWNLKRVGNEWDNFNKIALTQKDNVWKTN